MVVIPLEKKLKKRAHRSIASAQDIIVLELYNSFSNAVIHGGTGIWRCYGSNRFSEDVDVYIPPEQKEPKRIEVFLKSLNGYGFVVKKFKLTDNSIFSKFSYFGTIVSFEALFKGIKNFVTKPFEMTDGTFMTVHTLTAENMVTEKVSAYKKRRKVRDLYDIFFLLGMVESKETVRMNLKNLLEDFKQPVDVKDLRALIIWGAIPTLDDMLKEVKRWVK